MSAYGEMAIQAGLNSAIGVVSNAMARQREAEARAENYRYGEMAATKADQRARRLYADLQSPEALLKQYKDAGLSPSLMFGNGGSQGATPAQGAQGSGSSGISPKTFGIDPVNLAQIGLINAQAEKTKAETKTIEDVRKPTIDNINADTQRLLAETDNKKAETAYIDVQTEIARLEEEIKAATQEDVIETVGYNLEIVANKSQIFWWEIKLNELEFDFQSKTFMERKDVIEETVNKLQSDILRNAYGNALDEANITLISGKLQEINNNYYVALQNIALRGLEGKVKVAELKNATIKWQEELKVALKVAEWQTQTQIEGKVIDGLFGITQGFGTKLVGAGLKGLKK